METPERQKLAECNTNALAFTMMRIPGQIGQ
jgi:hypothetical protein